MNEFELAHNKIMMMGVILTAAPILLFAYAELFWEVTLTKASKKLLIIATLCSSIGLGIYLFYEYPKWALSPEDQAYVEDNRNEKCLNSSGLSVKENKKNFYLYKDCVKNNTP